MLFKCPAGPIHFFLKIGNTSKTYTLNKTWQLPNWFYSATLRSGKRHLKKTNSLDSHFKVVLIKRYLIFQGEAEKVKGAGIPHHVCRLVLCSRSEWASVPQKHGVAIIKQRERMSEGCSSLLSCCLWQILCLSPAKPLFHPQNKVDHLCFVPRSFSQCR